VGFTMHDLHHRDTWIGILVAWLPLILVGLWFVYRVVRGWVALGSGRRMFV
jgi:uncharacterized membrane protein